jgi:hypothetical protein
MRKQKIFSGASEKEVTGNIYLQLASAIIPIKETRRAMS